MDKTYQYGIMKTQKTWNRPKRSKDIESVIINLPTKRERDPINSVTLEIANTDFYIKLVLEKQNF